jgi:tRNA nucleotidyltransferase (CCA-adding enzyme)
MSLEAEVLKNIKPTRSDDRKVRQVVAELSEMIAEAAVEEDAHIEVMLVGSVAKGTHLKDPDIDLFMLFPESTSLDTLKEKGLAIGRRVVEGREYYAQHPYVRGVHKGFQVDIVPCFRIRDTLKKMSAVDRTPFHTEFVRGRMTPQLADQVRLLKRFMKGVGCYGAEAKVQGFSGYLCELLVLRYGAFRSVLESASSWARNEHIELEPHGGGEFDEPLTFIDPVDTTRNVASAVSLGTMLLFIEASREYLSSPTEKFFFPKERRAWSAAKVESAGGERLDNIVSVSFPKIDLIDDVIYPQFRKSLSSAVSLLERQEFEVVGTSIHVDGLTHLMVELASATLPKERKHRGPPESSDNAKEFLEKWRSAGLSKPFVERGRWYVMAAREHARAEDLLKASLKSLRLGKDVKKVSEFSVLRGRELLSSEHLAALTNHLDDRRPWQR